MPVASAIDLISAAACPNERRQIVQQQLWFKRPVLFNISTMERSMRMAQAALYGFLATCYGGCFYFAIGVFVTLAQKGDIRQFLGNFIVSMVVCFVGLTFIIHELMGAFEALNRPREPRENDTEKHEDKKTQL